MAWRPGDQRFLPRGETFGRSPLVSAPFESFQSKQNAAALQKQGLSDAEVALKLRSLAAQKARQARAKADIADSLRAISLFDSMTPAQAARLYTDAPADSREAELQDRLQESEDAGRLGFELGYKSDIANRDQAIKNATLSRQLRAADLAYENAKEDQGLKREQLKRQREQLDVTRGREQRLEENQDDRAHRDELKGAIGDVSSGAVSPEDVHFLYPNLDDRELEIVRSYGRQRRSEIGAGNSQAQSVADQLNQELAAARQSVALGKSSAQKAAEVKSITDKALKLGGLIQYDPATRSFTPVVQAEPTRRGGGITSTGNNPFYFPTVRGASPDHPIATPRGPVQGPMPAQTPLNAAFDVLAGAQPRDTVVEQLNSRAAVAPVGKRVFGRDGSVFEKTANGWTRRR